MTALSLVELEWAIETILKYMELLLILRRGREIPTIVQGMN